MLIENAIILFALLTPLLIAAAIADGIQWLAARKARRLPRPRVTRV